MAIDYTKKYLMRRYDLTGSMNQSTNPFLMKDTDFLYMCNTTNDEIGTVGKDGGYSIVGTTRTAPGKGDLLFDFIPFVGSHTPLLIEGGILQKYVSGWSNIDVDDFTDDARASGVNFNGKAYIATANDDLRYTDGSTVVSIATDNGGSSVRGRYLAVVADKLCIGNMTSVHAANQVVFSLEGTHIFYDSTDETGHNTYATTDRIITVDGAVTGLASYQGLLMIFTSEAIFYWNPSNNEVKKLCSFGTDSHWSIKELNGMLYFANRDGIYRFNGETIPELISIPITNWAINSLWRLIDGNNWSTMSAETFEGKYLLAVGDLTATMPGDSSAKTGVVIVYDSYRNTWSFLDGHPVSMFMKTVNENGDQRLWFCSSEDRTVYQKDYSYSHNGTTYNMIARTKYFDFDMPENQKNLYQLFTTYRSYGDTSSYITVSIATDGSNAYTEKIADDTVSKLELSGAEGRAYEMKRVDMTGSSGRTISYEFKNGDEGVAFEIVGFTQEFSYREPNFNVST